MGEVDTSNVLVASLTPAPRRVTRERWVAPNRQVITLPVDVTVTERDERGTPYWTMTARVALREGAPATVDIRLRSDGGLYEDVAQREFRWSYPREVVSQWMPKVMAQGLDPFTAEVPTSLWGPSPKRDLTEAFLAEIVSSYQELGRGYAAALAEQYEVSPRTVYSWMEKAREIGLVESLGRGRLATSKTQG